jgi:hypothetical protein
VARSRATCSRAVVVRPRSPTPGLTTDMSDRNNPRHQAQIRSALGLPGCTSLDLVLRYVGELPAQRVPAYTSLDLRLAWRPAQRLELAVVGQNLLDPQPSSLSGVTGPTVNNEHDRLTLSRPIHFDGKLVGTVLVRADLSERDALLRRAVS